MNALLLEYLPILIFFAIAAAIGIGFMVAAFVIAPSRPDPEKVSTYECGAVTLREHLGQFEFWSMMVFLGILTIGFVYELKKGALDWE